MSKYEWESGSIIIPTKEWSNFRTALVTEWNKSQDKLFLDALATLKTIKEQNKGKRGVNWRDVTCRYVEEKFEYDDAHEILRLILSNGKLITPKKKDLKIYPVSKSAAIMTGDRVTITLKNETHTVHYNVPDNNHACSDARNLPIVRKMFTLLNKITWTRGSGGEIIGNDEYNRDSECDGGGGNYVKDSYGLNK